MDESNYRGLAGISSVERLGKRVDVFKVAPTLIEFDGVPQCFRPIETNEISKSVRISLP